MKTYNINRQLGMGYLRGSDFSNADGDSNAVEPYITTKTTPTFYAVPIIIRDNIAGIKLNVGQTIVGKSTSEKVSVINNDGSDAAAYYFVVAELDGKQVFINKNDLQNTDGDNYKVINSTYPYSAEFWTNIYYTSTNLPKDYKITGTLVNLKTDTSGYNPVVKPYIKTIINDTVLYVPMDAVRSNVRRRTFNVAPLETVAIFTPTSSPTNQTPVESNPPPTPVVSSATPPPAVPNTNEEKPTYKKIATTLLYKNEGTEANPNYKFSYIKLGGVAILATGIGLGIRALVKRYSKP